MPIPTDFLSTYWHLLVVAAVILVISLSYGAQFVLPAMRLRGVLSRATRQLAEIYEQGPTAHIHLPDIGRDIMSTPTLQVIWPTYARTLQPRWQSPSTGPLGSAKARAERLSKAFFSEMNNLPDGEQRDLSDLEHMAQSHPHLRELWQEYSQALDNVAQLEADPQQPTGQWQTTSAAELFYSEHALVDSPLQVNFYKHVPGILTGIGIIGTFSGLIMGLIHFDVSNPDQVQLALSQLVQSVGHAFLISALAITLAMVFTWTEKALLTARYRQVEQLQGVLDMLFPPGGDSQQLERLTRATEMQTALSFKILRELRQSAQRAAG
jgi:hypothetical protein